MKQPDIRGLLKTAGFKATPSRLAILEVLAHEEKPFAVHELEQRLKGKINEVTLYRALEAFAAKGIVRRVDLGHDHTHYELEQKHHHHFVCITCGEVEDIKICPLPQIKNRTISSHSLEFFGLCKSCTI
jgi:Fe2+ or Zn2+ uptake regulation protein